MSSSWKTLLCLTLPKCRLLLQGRYKETESQTGRGGGRGEWRGVGQVGGRGWICAYDVDTTVSARIDYMYHSTVPHCG